LGEMEIRVGIKLQLSQGKPGNQEKNQDGMESTIWRNATHLIHPFPIWIHAQAPIWPTENEIPRWGWV
jgi:hypothetical protein